MDLHFPGWIFFCANEKPNISLAKPYFEEIFISFIVNLILDFITFFVLWFRQKYQIVPLLIMVLSIKQSALRFQKVAQENWWICKYSHANAMQQHVEASIPMRLRKWQFKIDDFRREISAWECEMSIKQSSLPFRSRKLWTEFK